MKSTMKGLVVVGLIVEEILNMDVKCVKVTGAQNIGQDTCSLFIEKHCARFGACRPYS